MNTQIDKHLLEKVTNKINLKINDEGFRTRDIHNNIVEFLNKYPNRFLADPNKIATLKKQFSYFIGAGAGGSVIKINKNGINYACKIVKFYGNIESAKNDFINEIAYQGIISEFNISPKIYDFFLYNQNNSTYGVMIMDYLENYYTIGDFNNNISLLDYKTKNTISCNYNISLSKLLEMFIKLNIFIFDFQFMINQDGTDIKLLDFGSVTEFRPAPFILQEGDEEEGEEDIMFKDINEYREYLYNIFKFECNSKPNTSSSSTPSIRNSSINQTRKSRSRSRTRTRSRTRSSPRSRTRSRTRSRSRSRLRSRPTRSRSRSRTRRRPTRKSSRIRTRTSKIKSRPRGNRYS